MSKFSVSRLDSQTINETTIYLTAAVLVQSVERVDCRAGGRTNTQGLKITEK